MADERAPSPPNVIFLDIDGVLQPGNSQDRFSHDMEQLQEQLSNEWDPGYSELNRYDIAAVYYDWDSEAVAHLRALCEEAPAKLVISSNWRESKSIEELKLLFRLQDLDGYVVDATPELSHCTRDMEIEAYLVAHPEVQRFAVLDDAYISDLKRRFPREFVYCRFKLEAEHYEQALAVFAEPLREDAEQAEALLEAVVRNAPHVTEATFLLDKISLIKRRRRWSIADFMGAFCEGLARNAHLERLTLSGIGHDVPYSTGQLEELTAQFTTAFAANRSVRHLDLSDNSLANVSGFLLSLSHREPRIETLALGRNRLDDESQKALAELVRNTSHPLALDIKGCCHRLGQDVIQAIAETPCVSAVIYRAELDDFWGTRSPPENLAVERGGLFSWGG